jgi:hypothetical protein
MAPTPPVFDRRDHGGKGLGIQLTQKLKSPIETIL